MYPVSFPCGLLQEMYSNISWEKLEVKYDLKLCIVSWIINIKFMGNTIRNHLFIEVVWFLNQNLFYQPQSLHRQGQI